MCFACPSHGLVNIPSSKSFSSPFPPALLAQMYDEPRVHHVHNKLLLSLSLSSLVPSLSLGLFEESSQRVQGYGDVGTRGAKRREGQRTEETSIEARRMEEQEEEGRSTAPMLGKFGVTRGDEDERERERERERRRARGARGRKKNERRRENLLGGETIAHRGGPVIDSHTPRPPSKPGLFLYVE